MLEQKFEERKMKVGKLNRASSADFVASEDDNVLEFPFSSELPVERWFGDEVLSHRDGAADLARLNDSAALLWNHNPDNLIGVVERAWITGGRGYCQVRFGTSPMAQQVRDDVKAGIIRNVSFGYRILDMEESKDGKKAQFTATRWAPYEISLVSIPADPSVGLGRAAEDSYETTVRGVVPEEEKPIMTTPAAPAAPVVDEAAIRAAGAAAERDRIGTIRALGDKFDDADLARQLIDGNRSIDDARTAFLEKIGAKQKPVGGAPESGVVDLSEREQKEYSLCRAIMASINKDWSKAGFELEVSRTLASEMGRDTDGFFMPTNLRTAYNVGTPTQGGNLVATNLLASSFIEVLRNKAVMMQLGVTTLAGLVGNVAIPRQTSGTQTYWVSEGTAITEAEALFDQVSLSPKQLGALSEWSRLALQQATPDIEMLVRNDFAKVMALGIDAAIINGSGTSGQPKGILNQSGIGSVAMGTNGAALAASSTTVGTGIDPLIDLEALLDVGNALDGSLAYVTNAKGIKSLKKLKDQYGGYIWGNGSEDLAGGTIGSINGYGVARTNQVPSNLVKGTSGANCSAILFGDYSQVVVGLWGGLEILPNPYDSTAYTKGAVRIRAMQTADVTIRHAESFAAITDLLTP